MRVEKRCLVCIDFINDDDAWCDQCENSRLRRDLHLRIVWRTNYRLAREHCDPEDAYNHAYPMRVAAWKAIADREGMSVDAFVSYVESVDALAEHE